MHKGSHQVNSIIFYLVHVTESTCPSQVTNTRVVSDPIQTRSMVTHVVLTFINVDTTRGPGETDRTRAFKLVSWVRANTLVETLILVAEDAFTPGHKVGVLQDEPLLGGDVDQFHLGEVGEEDVCDPNLT